MLLLVDLDGVVYRGAEPVPGVAELLSRRVASGDRVVYCTNNSRWHRSEYTERLERMGAPVAPDSVLTSARATALAVAAAGRRGVAMVMGGHGLRLELEEVGVEVVGPDADGLAARPALVVLGVDFELSHERLSITASAVRAGAWFVATNRDAIYPAAHAFVAGAGAIVAAVEVAAGRRADLTVGKPEPALFLTAAEMSGERAERAVVIGDGLATDIAAANAVRARSVLVLTGVSTREQAESAPPERRPTAIAADVGELEVLLDRFAAEEPSAARTGVP